MTTDRPVFSVCSGVLAASLLLVLSPSAYADDMGGLWPVKDSAVVSAHEAGLDGSGVKVGMYDMQVVSACMICRLFRIIRGCRTRR